jgi:hypothetical protein
VLICWPLSYFSLRNCWTLAYTVSGSQPRRVHLHTLRASDAWSGSTSAGIPQSATPSISAGRVTILKISSSDIPSNGSVVRVSVSFIVVVSGGDRGREGPALDASAVVSRVTGEGRLELIGRSWVSSLAAAFPFPFDLPFLSVGVGIDGGGTARKHHESP